MKITILTLFDEIYPNFLNSSIIKRAIEKKLIEIEIINFRSFSLDKHKKVDDYQIGGGPGMVIKLQPIVDAIKYYQEPSSKVILTSPSGQVLNQELLKKFSTIPHIILIAGHYEGFDARLENYIDDSISIGDYVLTGGELPSLVMLDGIIRLIPGVINADSLESESFNNDLLDYPAFTKPIDYEGHIVPEILLSGNHQAIDKYRHEEQIKLTKNKRPDLYKKFLKKGTDNDIK